MQGTALLDVNKRLLWKATFVGEKDLTFIVLHLTRKEEEKIETNFDMKYVTKDVKKICQ